MNPSAPVLRDIHLPNAPWWPLAPGWLLLAGLLVLAAACAGGWLLRRARRRPLAAALREIDRLAAAFADDGDVAALVDAASRLLRRVARTVDPAAAATDGEAWREFVQAGARNPGIRGALDALLDARFRAHPQLDGVALIVALRAWCKQTLRSDVRRKPRPQSRGVGIAAAGSPPA